MVFRYLLVDDAAPPGPLDDAAPPPDPPLLLDAAPPPLPDVLPELGGAGATVVVLELDEEDFPGLLLPAGGTMTVVSFFSSHPVNANAPRIANT